LFYSSFQHAVVRSINDKNAQMQKQLENVVREGTVSPYFGRPIFTVSLANGEISLLSSKVSGAFLLISSTIFLIIGQSLNVIWNWSAGRFVTCRIHRENGTKNIRNSRSALSIYNFQYSNIQNNTCCIKAQHDKIKRKALLAPNTTGQDVSVGFGGSLSHVVDRQTLEDHQGKGRTGFGSNTVDLGAVIGGMEANGVYLYLNCNILLLINWVLIRFREHRL
jgi:hypothetical protein